MYLQYIFTFDKVLRLNKNLKRNSNVDMLLILYIVHFFVNKSLHILKVNMTSSYHRMALLSSFPCILIYEMLCFMKALWNTMRLHVCEVFNLWTGRENMSVCRMREVETKKNPSWPSMLCDSCRPQVPKECRRPVEDPEMLSTACSRECKNGHCTPTGKCCCSAGWEGPFCLRGTEPIRALSLCL